MPIWKEKCFVVTIGLFQAFFWQGRIPGPTPAPAQPQQPTDCVTKSLQSWLDLGLKSALELGRDTPNAVRGLSN